ncbi:hypothetical protein AMTRI_Chr08g163370 [Amborella trichopoda]|uniref:Uncharacterized protein n=2 Tax=Amborella trichopoda TaxID=13333 RepID=W1PJN1_AMBTC|nr:hypothetical protein AMTR_s00168p00052130 [Amborella trichopoda]
MGSYNNNSNSTNFDNLLLRTLMGRLQLRPPYLNNNSFLSQNLDDFLLEATTEDDDEKTPLAKEELKLEREIVRLIHMGNTETLKPNSSQAVTIGEHHVCVGFHEDPGSEYRVWEWHGHIMLFDEENGYSPEYIYGNYFERAPVKEEKESDGESENVGLRELIGDAGSDGGRIVRRNLNAGSKK